MDLDHDGLVTHLVQPWWVRWLVLWIVPVLLGLAALPRLARPGLLALSPGWRGWILAPLGILSVTALAAALAVVVLVGWWTAPVEIRLRGPTLTVTRRFVGRSWARRFDLRRTVVYEAVDRSSLRLVMEVPGRDAVEEVVAVPFALRRSGWLGGALRAAVAGAATPAPPGPSDGDRQAMAELLASTDPSPRR